MRPYQVLAKNRLRTTTYCFTLVTFHPTSWWAFTQHPWFKFNVFFSFYLCSMAPTCHHKYAIVNVARCDRCRVVSHEGICRYRPMRASGIHLWQCLHHSPAHPLVNPRHPLDNGFGVVFDTTIPIPCISYNISNRFINQNQKIQWIDSSCLLGGLFYRWLITSSNMYVSLPCSPHQWLYCIRR
jgi:hypothetical protein